MGPPDDGGSGLGDGGNAGGAPDKFAQAAEYLAAHPGRLWAHLTLFVVLAALFGLLGRQRDRWTTAEFAIHWPASLLGRPIAAAALLSIAFLQVLYPRAPQGVYGLAFLAVLPALVLLLRQLLIAPLRVPAFLLAALYALRVLADTFLTGALASRVVLLLLAAAGVVVFVWFAERVAGGQGGMWRVGRILAMAGAMLLAGAFLANGYGFITLASLLVSATLASALAALALVALVDVVVGAVLVVLMVTPVGALEVIQRHRPRVTRRVTTVVRLAGVVVWGTVALRQFRALEPTLGGMGRVLAAPIAVGSWNFTTGDVVIFLLAIVVAVVIARGLREVLRQDVLARMRLGRGVPDAVAGIAYYTLLALGFVFAAGAAGIDLSRLALIAGALGVGIGFGLQSIVANFISGLILLFERPVQSGDTVEFDGLKGVVQSIGMRASIVRTFQGADVIVPNQDFIVGRVVNWTLSDQTRRVEIPVGVAYGSDPARVIALLTETAARCRGVLPKPAPQVLFTAFGESSLDFEIRLWSAADTWLETQSAVLVAAYQALAEARIEIPFPQRDLHVRSVDGGVARSFGRTPS